MCVFGSAHCVCVRVHTAVAVRDQYTHLRVKTNDSDVLQESTPESTERHQPALMLKNVFLYCTFKYHRGY